MRAEVMGPRKRAIWFPLVRLCVFVVAVALTGHSILRLLHNPAHDGTPRPSTQALDAPKTYLEKRMDRIERRILREMTAPRLHRKRRAKPEERKEPEAVRPSRALAPLPLAAIQEESRDAGSELAANRPAPKERIAAYFAPDSPSDPFAYLRSDFPTALAVDAEPDPPLPIGRDGWLDEYEPFSGSLYSDWVAECRISGIEDAANTLFSIPERLIDLAVEGLRSLKADQSEVPRSLDEDEDMSLTARLLDIEQTRPRLRRPFVTFVHRLIEEEADFLSDFRSSVVNTPEFEYGGEDVDLGDLHHEQVKVLWDAVKATYLRKYRVRGDQQIRSSDMYFRQWRGVDFVVMPSLLAGYAYYRGLEKRIKIGDARLRIHLEPVKRILSSLDGDLDRPSLAGVEFYVKGFPVRVIVSAGVYDRNLEVDFIGIGSDFGQIRQVLTFGED